MTVAVDIYKNGTKLGSGTATAGSTSITSFSAQSGRTVGSGRNVQITATNGNNVGFTWSTRVVTDGGSTLTTHHPHSHT